MRQAPPHSGGIGEAGTCTQPLDGEQESSVQVSWSSQKLGGLGVFTHPAVGEQESSVQAL
jgi:hypothetical protein